MEPQVDNLLRFFLTVGECKSVLRTGWVENGVKDPETVAAHMYRMSVLGMFCPDPALDRNKIVQMCLCHDMAESIIGDVSPKMGVPKDVKMRKEAEAATDLCALLEDRTKLDEEKDPSVPYPPVKELFEEYEAQNSPESHFVRDLDLLDMVIQAYRYETAQGLTLDTFFESSLPRFKHPWSRRLAERLHQLRSEGHKVVLEPIPQQLLTAETQ